MRQEMSEKSFGSIKSRYLTETGRIKTLILPTIVWFFLIIISLATNLKTNQSHFNHLLTEQSRAFFNEIVITRLWNAQHGGVYVVVTDKTQPNPYLDLPVRDVATTTGVKLTMINPAYMTRQISELTKGKNNVTFHITSLKPLRPGNEPDSWEENALLSFEKGKKEFAEVVESEIGDLFRYMAPLSTDKACLKCHAKQGYRLGDIRGGISITIPMGVYTASNEKEKKNLVVLHLIFFLGGAAAIAFFKIYSFRTKQEMLKLSYAIEQSPNATIITDPKGRIEYVNPQFEQTTGYSSREVLGNRLQLLNSDEKNVEGLYPLWEKTDEASQWKEEVINRKKDGNHYWEMITVSPIRNLKGVIDHFLIIKEDITQRKNAEQELLKSQSELAKKHDELKKLFSLMEQAKKEWEATMNCLGDIVILTDNNGKIIRFNNSISKISDKPFDNIASMSIEELFSESELQVSDIYGQSVDIFHQKSKKWFVFNSYEYIDTDGKTSGHVITMHDSSDIKRVTNELSRRNEELQHTTNELKQAYTELKSAQSHMLQHEKMASIGQLAAGVAHEINNPVGFIMSNLNTLKKYTERIRNFMDLQSEAVRKGIDEKYNMSDVQQTIESALKDLKIPFILEDTNNLITESIEGAERVKRIVQDMKSFSRVDQSEQKLSNINEGLDSTINILWNELKYKTTLTKEYGDIPFTRCNLGQINQVFMNILMNAAHAIPKQGQITVKTWSNDSHIFVSISDTGIGIPEDKLNRIFEPFYTTKDVGKGTGLGLSIAFDIIKKHGGDISAKSEVGKGSTFTIKLPVVTE
ncbi:MAG: DUF3365 domain-containing protein [Dissulfurispiraceae bacterium]|jgi:two-component system NtrC family sensor kinase|nr:DUF3365 domain-containing protein [Dissulfurispiraceae bacterium]